jgi:hypothetical protein
LASLSDVLLPTLPAMLWICDVKVFVASCTCWRRSSERLPWASLIFDRSLLMALRLFCTPSTVTVETVRPLSWSTCLLMSARASQTVLLALSCLDSPQAPSPRTATTAISANMMEGLMAANPPSVGLRHTTARACRVASAGTTVNVVQACVRPQAGPGARSTQRKPMCVVEVSTASPWRAAGRKRRQ